MSDRKLPYFLGGPDKNLLCGPNGVWTHGHISTLTPEQAEEVCRVMNACWLAGRRAKAYQIEQAMRGDT